MCETECGAEYTLLTFTQLVGFLQVDEPTCLRLVENGSVPHPLILDTDVIRWSSCDLVEWISESCPKLQPPGDESFQVLRESIGRADLERRLKKSKADKQYMREHPPILN